eukprot:gene2218-biopygen1984
MVAQQGKSFREVSRILKISHSSVYRCYTEGIDSTQGTKKQGNEKKKRGRPRILSERQVSYFLRTFHALRADGRNPTVKEIMNEAGVTDGSYRTYVRILNDAGYRKLQPRKKGLLSVKDKVSRKRFARQALKQHEDSFWTKEVAFYLDGVSFIHKYNPFQEASKPKGRIYRKRSEGLRYTTSGSKNLAGGRRFHVLVAVSYNSGVIMVEPYEKMTGQFFADFVRSKLPRAFIGARVQCRKSRMAKFFVMDNEPCQTSKLAMDALHDIGATLLRIPARSPDLNPIENVFHNVKRALQNQALAKKLTRESYEEFSRRVLDTLWNSYKDVIQRTIDNMPQRMKLIVATKGDRTKY